jgi:hypothetical protein
MTASMPRRGSREAPASKTDQPHFLRNYFSHLEDLLAECAIKEDVDKKKYTIYYLDYETRRVWELLPEFSDATKTYLEFKKAILDSYFVDDDSEYTLGDLNSLISNCQKSGIRSLADLATFQQQFISISSYLILKKRLSEIEQAKVFISGFPPALWTKISQRLQLKFPDHHLDDPYTIQQIQEAAKFVLHGTPNSTTSTPISNPSDSRSTPSSTAPDANIKSESITAILSELTKTIASLVTAQTHAQTQSASSPRASKSNNNSCNYCGGPHFIRDCDKVEEHIKEGKVRRNTEGKVVLSTGAFVPRDIPGTLLEERVNEWHKRNPGQLARGVLSSNTQAFLNSIAPPSSTFVSPKPSTTTVNKYTISVDDRIALLEAEIFSLKARQPGFRPIIRTRAQKAREATIEEEDEDPEPTPAQPTPAPLPPSLKKPASTTEIHSAPPAPSKTSSNGPSIPKIPVPAASAASQHEHPYRKAQDASYLPPVLKNVAAPSKQNVIKKPETTPPSPPIYEQETAAKIYNRSLDTRITMTQRELLSIAPDIRNAYRDVTTVKRASSPDRSGRSTNILEEEDSTQQYSMEYRMPSSLALAGSMHRSPPIGATIIEDPIEIYYRNLQPGEDPDPDRIKVARESYALRSVYSIIDNTQRVECILDAGCQIIAMSEEICHDLSLVYDPTIKIRMQSANATYDYSLGLARHVPFYLGGITLYMQVHIIRAPAYDVLLGRPFDVLTCSTIQNFANEDQTITISDPNSGRVVTIPTIARSSHRYHHCAPPRGRIRIGNNEIHERELEQDLVTLLNIKDEPEQLPALIDEEPDSPIEESSSADLEYSTFQTPVGEFQYAKIPMGWTQPLLDFDPCDPDFRKSGP